MSAATVVKKKVDSTLYIEEAKGIWGFWRMQRYVGMSYGILGSQSFNIFLNH